MEDKWGVKAIVLLLAIVLNASMICLMVANYLKLPDTNTNYIISTHYFADEWPMNFWNAEWDTIDQDFKQIKKDGFNTVIVVVPWREFQPGINPIQYNEVVWERLQTLFEKTAEHGLNVQIRAGYLHDFMGESDPADRFYHVIGDKNVRDAWYEYMGRLYKVCSEFDNFAGGFITWEDFWHNYRLGVYLTEQEEERLNYARLDSFGQFLSGKYTLEDFNLKYDEKFADFNDIPIPCEKDTFMREWYEWVDIITLDILQKTRESFPGLFMEVRTDNDVIPGNEKYSHDMTWNCRDGEMTGIMYQIAQGLGINREQLTAEAAVQSMERWLQKIYERNGQIPIYMEQFLFYDNTPGNKNGDIILAINEEDYFINCVPVLKEYTNGYGVWAYKDYCNNILYNSQFVFALEGWEHKEGVVSNTDKDSNRVCLTNNSIYQSIPAWRKPVSTGENYIFSMDYDVATTATFTICVGEQVKAEEVSGRGELHILFDDKDDMSITIKCNGRAYIDNVKLYNMISTQQLYGIDNSEKNYIDEIRKMNRLLNE